MVMGATVGREALQAGILEAQLFVQEVHLLP
jgi:hypothetical protein